MADNKIDARTAGYMELSGARKDANCQIVSVIGGVSSKLGCCNMFSPEMGADEFKCGECKFVQESPLVQALSGFSNGLLGNTFDPKEVTLDELLEEEKCAIDLYSKAIEQYADPHIKGVLAELMQDEQDHAAQLKALGALDESDELEDEE